MPPKRRKRSRWSKPPTKVAAQDWYTIRGILDERSTDGRIEYLVDWDDDPVTGESYPASWSYEVTVEAKVEWNKVKATRQKVQAARQKVQAVRERVQATKQRSEAPAAATSRATQDSSESQSPRPANRRKIQRHNAASSLTRTRSATPDNDRPTKAPRLAYSATPSEEPVPSVTSAASLDTVEALDSARREDPSAAGQGRRLVIELVKDAQLDPSEYLSAANTQTSLNSSQSLAELEDRDERLALASQISARTVPDSQEPSGPTWSECQRTNPAASPRDLGPSKGQLGSEATSSNIPSRQPRAPDLLSPGGDDLAASAPATTAAARQLSSDSLPLAATAQTRSTTSPVFLTQPSVQNNFNLPESSLQSPTSASPHHTLVKATPLEESRPSDENLSQASAGSQDAQVAYRDEFRPPMDTFTGSRENNRESAADNRPPASREHESPVSSSQRTEEGHAGEAPPGTRDSAAHELSQLFNLDSAMVEATPAALHPAPRPDAPVESAQPAPVAEPEPSVVHSMQNLLEVAFGPSSGPPSGTLVPSEAQHKQQPTVSPAEISTQAHPERMAPLSVPLFVSQQTAPSHLEDSPRESIPMVQVPCEQASREASSEGAPDQGLMEHVVTLPFQASLRPLYDDTLLEHRRDVTEFGTAFNNEIYVPPDEALVQKIDRLFSRLLNICDYPQDAVGTVLEDLPPAQLAKYSCDANPKFSFIYELLHGLHKDTGVLIVARSVELLRLLYYLTEALSVECVCSAIGKTKSEFSASAARVTLALPGEELVGSDFDVVIGFDHSFSTSPVSKGLGSENRDKKGPLLLVLVTTHSIDHIDLHLPEDLGPLERKNALLSAIVRARKLVSDPERVYPEPHEIAGIFVDYLNSETDIVVWEPVPVPDEVLDIFISTQSLSQRQAPTLEQENGRKRKFNDSDDEDAKRMRVLPLKESTVEAKEPPLPDDVREMLDDVHAAGTAIQSSKVHVKIPLAVLQALAEKARLPANKGDFDDLANTHQNAELQRQVAAKDAEAEYKAVISGLQQRVKEYERSTNKIYKAHRRAVEDRSKFETDKVKAEATLQATTELAKRDSEKAQERIAELEATVARLTTGPDGSEESRLAKMEGLLGEAQGRVKTLEKRLENAHKDGEYVRNLYQEASGSAAAIQAENVALKERNDELLKKATDNLVKVHEIQEASNSRQLLGQVRELKAQARERELELERVREELRQLRNGRRETRQVSVPRSPRMGVMSPRNGRPYGGPGSRGTSPASATGLEGPALLPGMHFMSAQQPGNGRWNHLRD